MTHPGVGALTGLAFVLIIGKVERQFTTIAETHGDNGRRISL
jgi:hypothetical protein